MKLFLLAGGPHKGIGIMRFGYYWSSTCCAKYKMAFDVCFNQDFYYYHTYSFMYNTYPIRSISTN